MVDKWLCANKLCLNIEKTNFIVFHPAQKKINYSLILKMQEQQIREKQSIKYLGIFIDSHLNWKSHIGIIKKDFQRNRHSGEVASLCIYSNIAANVQCDYLFIPYVCRFVMGKYIYHKFKSLDHFTKEGNSYYNIF